MSNPIEADLDALQNLITKLQNGINNLEGLHGPLQSAYSQFIATYQSSRKHWVEEEFRNLDDRIFKAKQLEQSLYDGFQQVLTDLEGADGNTRI